MSDDCLLPGSRENHKVPTRSESGCKSQVREGQHGATRLRRKRIPGDTEDTCRARRSDGRGLLWDDATSRGSSNRLKQKVPRTTRRFP